jgi:hypothetical protein
MDGPEIAAAVSAIVMLMGAHVAAVRLGPLHGQQRAGIRSAFGGVAVAYVFLHLLPELAAGQETVAESPAADLPWVDRHVYLLALAGLAVFYGIETAARSSRRRAGDHPDSRTELETFVASMIAFTLYNALVGYLLVDRLEQDGALAVLLLATALALHLVVNDASLREHHRDRYDRLGRWVLAGAVPLGWVLGIVVELSAPIFAALLAFLAGGIALNALKEELPAEREGRFGAFAIGAGGCTVVLLAL